MRYKIHLKLDCVNIHKDAAPQGRFFFGSSATIGDATSFNGNVLALTSITMNSGAIAYGRMLAINGAVVLTSTNTISRP